MKKEIKMRASKYTIEYDPAKQWDYHIKRYGEDVSHKLRTNVMDDIVFYLTENIENGVVLDGITVSKIMLDSITANEIVNVLQSKGNSDNLKWVENNYLNTFITMDIPVNVITRNGDYCVMPILFFKRRYRTTESFPYKRYVLGFVYEGSVYEVGKYTLTTSKLFTNLYNTYFANNKYERVYIPKCK